MMTDDYLSFVRFDIIEPACHRVELAFSNPAPRPVERSVGKPPCCVEAIYSEMLVLGGGREVWAYIVSVSGKWFDDARKEIPSRNVMVSRDGQDGNNEFVQEFFCLIEFRFPGPHCQVPTDNAQVRFKRLGILL